MTRVESLLAECRSRIARIGPQEAASLQANGALLVDIRPEEQRRAFGRIPESLVVERNVLEWRLDPTEEHRHPRVSSADMPIVIFCQEGFASSLAVESLQRLGLTRVFDLEGGFVAWRALGLATTNGNEDVP